MAAYLPMNSLSPFRANRGFCPSGSAWHAEDAVNVALA